MKHKDFLENRADKKRRRNAKWWNYTFPMHKEYYKYDKIWCSYRAKNNEFIYDNTKNYIGFTNTTVIFGNNDNCNLKYILALLNSKTLAFKHHSIAKQTGNGVYEYVPNVIEVLPIPKVTQEQQENLAQKADLMIQFNKKLHDETQKAIELIKLEYKPKKISQNLEKFHSLGFNPFIEELQKQGVKLTLSQKEDLMNWYKSKSESINSIVKEISKIDNEIDKEVYKLYNLSDDEIKIIENSI